MRVGSDFVGAALSSAAVLRLSASSLMPLRQAPHQQSPKVIRTSNHASKHGYQPARLGCVAQRNQGGAAALGRAGDIRGATYPGLAGQHNNSTHPRIENP